MSLLFNAYISNRLISHIKDVESTQNIKKKIKIKNYLQNSLLFFRLSLVSGTLYLSIH